MSTSSSAPLGGSATSLGSTSPAAATCADPRIHTAAKAAAKTDVAHRRIRRVDATDERPTPCSSDVAPPAREHHPNPADMAPPTYPIRQRDTTAGWPTHPWVASGCHLAADERWSTRPY